MTETKSAGGSLLDELEPLYCIEALHCVGSRAVLVVKLGCRVRVKALRSLAGTRGERRRRQRAAGGRVFMRKTMPIHGGAISRRGTRGAA